MLDSRYRSDQLTYSYFCFKCRKQQQGQNLNMPIKLFSKRKSSKGKTGKLSRKGSKDDILQEEDPQGASGSSGNYFKYGATGSMLSNSTSSGSENSAKFGHPACKQCGLLMKDGSHSPTCQLCLRLDPTFGQYLTTGQVSWLNFFVLKHYGLCVV